jgi:hypothetical protein
MKKRLHDKKAGIAILLALIAVSLAEVIYRAVTMGMTALNTSNAGEQLAVIVFAVAILILTVMGKDRACYICYGAWIGYFVLDQLFELPGSLVSTISTLSLPETWIFAGVIGNIGVIIHALSYIGVIVIGVLLAEYMIDGSIYNRAFNISCIFTLALILISIGICVYNVATGAPRDLLLLVFNNLYRLTMVFMFTFFAYDSAKHQLKKANLSK